MVHSNTAPTSSTRGEIVTFWDWFWIGWLLWMVIGDPIANRFKGGTFSEHCRVWFGSPTGALTLGAFFLVLYLHLVANWPVYPVIVVGVGIAHYIRRSYVMFRWDKWFEGAVVACLGTVALSAAPLLSDGKITGVEAVMLVGAFCLAFGTYVKQHPPVE